MASCWEISSHNRLNSREVINNVFLILRKTREWRDEWSACGPRAFVRRESTHVDARRAALVVSRPCRENNPVSPSDH